MLSELTSNGMRISFDARRFEEMDDSGALLDDPERLSARYRQDGFLYLKGLLPRDAVLAVREEYFSLFHPDLFKPGTRPRDGIFSGRFPPGLPEHGLQGHPAHTLARSGSFHRFAARPELQAVAEGLLGGPVLQLRRRPIRQFFNGRKVASRAHMDHPYLDRGSAAFLTMWVPLGDCPLPAGGVIYLKESHGEDVAKLKAAFDGVTDRPWDRATITHDLERLADHTGRPWQWADYEAGDVIVHSPFIIHASLDPQTDLMRLSTDLRFVRQGGSIDPRWTADWAADDGY